jgi:hypothetical protein
MSTAVGFTLSPNSGPLAENAVATVLHHRSLQDCSMSTSGRARSTSTGAPGEGPCTSLRVTIARLVWHGLPGRVRLKAISQGHVIIGNSRPQDRQALQHGRACPRADLLLLPSRWYAAQPLESRGTRNLAWCATRGTRATCGLI